MNIKGNILIVDDDPLISMNYSDILEDDGYMVTIASGIKQAINIIIQRDFDLIVLDNDLGDGKGTDLIKYMEDNELAIPALYLSAAIPSIMQEISKLELVKQIIAKPVSPTTLRSSVEQNLDKSTTPTYPKMVGDDERNTILNNNFLI